MEQKNGQSVYEVMTKYAGEVIAEMAGEIFTTRNFIEPPGIEPGTQGFSVLCSTN